ncbi:MAG: radical SAM protein [Nitrospirota bacterium]
MHPIKLIKEKRKTHVLKPPAFGCFRRLPAVNITRGCAHSCVYCYARGFSDAPPKGKVHLYENLPELLERELERKAKRGRFPEWVTFSTASDAFQGIDEVMDITYSAMKMLLERGIGISFLTKGVVPRETIDLLRKYPTKVKARIGVVSFSEDYRRLFEPFSAPVIRRLAVLHELIEAGIDVSVRIDPIIPKVSGSEEWAEHLIKRLKVAGVKNISISHLVMRLSIMNHLMKELPVKLARDLLRLYDGQPWQRVITSARTRLLPKELRLSQYNMIKDISKRYGVECYICGCKNPDLPWEFCNPWVEKEVSPQLCLFERELPCVLES